jgi:hypothetical protein
MLCTAFSPLLLVRRPVSISVASLTSASTLARLPPHQGILQGSVLPTAARRPARYRRRRSLSTFLYPFDGASMDPQLSGFALGLLFGAAKLGAIGTIGFAIAWWRTRRKLERLESALPDPGILQERLANLEQNSDYIGAKVAELGEAQTRFLQQLGSSPRLPESQGRESEERRPPITPH